MAIKMLKPQIFLDLSNVTVLNMAPDTNIPFIENKKELNLGLARTTGRVRERPSERLLRPRKSPRSPSSNKLWSP